MLLEVYDNVNKVSFNLEDSKYICIAFVFLFIYFISVWQSEKLLFYVLASNAEHVFVRSVETGGV